MIKTMSRATPQAEFRWQAQARHTYQIASGQDVIGRLSLSPEPSILFEPRHCEYYRRTAGVEGRQPSFRCVLKDGDYQGCVAVEEGMGQPLALFEEQAAHVTRRQISWIVLCQEGTVWFWLPSGGRGEWVVRRQGVRIMDIHGPLPQTNGMVRVYDHDL